MNKNITVVNQNLWAVNFDHVRNGQIKEVSLEIADPSDHAAFTKDGKIILNSNQKDYPEILKQMKMVMGFSEQQLGSIQGFHDFIKMLFPQTKNLTDQEFQELINSIELNHVDKIFYTLSNMEKKRRLIQDRYIKSNKQSFGIDKIKGIMKRKGGVNYGKY